MNFIVERSVSGLLIIALLSAIVLACAWVSSGALLSILATFLILLGAVGCVMAGLAAWSCVVRGRPLLFTGLSLVMAELARVCAAISALSFVLLFISGMISARMLIFVDRTIPHVAIMVSIEESTQFGRPRYRPTYMFNLDDGSERHVRWWRWESRVSGSVGDQFFIRYDPKRPDMMRMNNSLTRWVVPVMLLFVGLNGVVLFGTGSFMIRPPIGSAESSDVIQ